jgi:Helix-loop-helix DNA-binding domain
MEKQLSVSSGNESRKRRNEDSENESDEQEDALSADAIAQMTRSERKRHREKKRRSDVNKGFDDLTSLLWEIDPTMRVEAEERATRLQTKGQSVGPPEAALLSRVDLISRATQLLRRLYHENEQNKNIISSLTRQGLIGSSVVSDLANLNRLAGQRNLDGSSQMNDEVCDYNLFSLFDSFEVSQRFTAFRNGCLTACRIVTTTVSRQQSLIASIRCI